MDMFEYVLVIVAGTVSRFRTNSGGRDLFCSALRRKVAFEPAC